jgi:hypothetical protein
VNANNPNPPVIRYCVKTPLHGLTSKPRIETVIPAGSTIEWQMGDYACGLPSVLWLRRRVLVTEPDLFAHCERV